MIETGVVIDKNNEPIYWHLPPGRDGGSLPDSRELWDVLWTHRERVAGFAHTHPGSGEPGPSDTDLTTFRALENALGSALLWWIATSDQLCLVTLFVVEQTSVFDRRDGDNIITHQRYNSYSVLPQESEPSWLARLRQLTYEKE